MQKGKVGLAMLIVIFIQASLSGQDEFTNYRRIHLDSASRMYHNGGNIAFLELIYQNINYPIEAREECRVGKLMTELFVSPENRIVRIEFKNPLPLGFGLEDEVVRTIALSASNWNTQGQGIIVPIVFSFFIETNESLKGDIHVIAYSTASHAGCPSSLKELESELLRLENRGKWEKAVSVCEELVRRYPENTAYVEKYQTCLKQAGG